MHENPVIMKEKQTGNVRVAEKSTGQGIPKLYARNVWKKIMHIFRYIIKFLRFFCIFSAVILIFACNSTKYKGIEAKLPDMESKSDGVYRGDYNLAGTPIKVILDVIVKNREIIEINIIKHSCSPIGKKAEKITEKIIKEQNLNIDAISGATGSSKAILKAVENAFQ